MKLKVEILQKGDKDHQDSFWYDGDIARVTYKDREILVFAEGDIRIHNKKGELVHDGKERGSGFPFKMEKDKDLKKIGNNYDDAFHWENNNWFGFLYKKKDWKHYEDVMGDVSYNYDGAVETAKTNIKDDKFWEQFEG